MPRNVTVTFSDGSTHLYQGIPDNVTPDQVTARAQKDFGLNVKALDGGRGAAPTTKPNSVTPAARSSAPGETRISRSQAQAVWDQASARLESKIASLPEAAKRKAREAFAADPSIQRLRQNISGGKRLNDPLVKQRMTQNARDRANQQVEESGNFLTALSGGVKKGLFGIPDRIAAAGVRFLPSALTGNESDADYGEILAQARANTDAEVERSLAGNILGQIAGGGAALKGVESLVKGTQAGRAALSAVQKSRAGRAAATAAKAAPRSTKVAAASAGGAAAGLAQAVGEGTDKSTGLAIGAVGGPAGLALGKSLGVAGKFLIRPVADVLGATKAGAILKRFTSATVEDIQAAADAYRKKTGAEPTLYELLPLADRNRLAKDIVGRTPQASEQAAAAVRQRVGNVGQEMQTAARGATEAERARIASQLESEFADAGVADPVALAKSAPISPIDMKNAQAAEANAVMEPFENQQVADTLQDIFPKSLARDEATGDIKEVFSDPEVNAALTNAASTLRLRLSPENAAADVAGLTAGDATRILRQLAKVQPGTPQSGAAMRAADRLMDYMMEKYPAAAGAVEKMRTTFARRARMVEGMAEGARTRTRESIPVETSAQARVVRNAFDTPEGEAGRRIGQANALDRELGGTTQDALRATGNIAESGTTQAALRGNLGDEAARRITGAAEAQSQSVRNLAALSRETSNSAETLGTEEIGRMLLALNPASMPTTKLFAISRITSLMHLPERRAKQLVDMLFSQDPAVTNRAVALLNRAGNPGREALQASASSY